MFPGISDRMQKELTSLSPASIKVCFIILLCNGPLIHVFLRSRLLLLLNESTLYGLVDLFWLL